MKRWLLLLLMVAAAAAFVVVPFFLIQPFRPQTGTGLAAGYEVRRLAPWATVALALFALLLVARMWRASRRRWARALMVLLLLPVGAAVWASRQNVYESMFKPLAAPAYARAGEVDYVGDEDMVLAVERGGERVAYPVRLMAYHHVVADTVGGVPLAATY
jgi:glucan phosphoethanolaminetransferase (alkaline phosphatase superfamily)